LYVNTINSECACAQTLTTSKGSVFNAPAENALGDSVLAAAPAVSNLSQSQLPSESSKVLSSGKVDPDSDVAILLSTSPAYAQLVKHSGALHDIF
jgi:hypothetical protein